MSSPDTLLETLRLYFKDKITECILVNGEPTIEVRRDALYEVCTTLRNDFDFSFDMLVDLCGVDYQQYGSSEWVTDQATQRGFDRGVTKETEFATAKWEKKRFAVVWHLLSLKHNHRLRLRAFTEETQPVMDSVVDIWPSANWYEREAFDLYGIGFTNHPDLRRLLTDYGFEGHPFRKDFPMIGETEVRYDKIEKKVIYEPVQSVTPRTVIPKVIRSSTDKSNEVPFNDN